MNKLKKISILFAAVLSLTMLASCGSDSKDTNKSDKSDSSTAEDKAVFGFKFTVNGDEYAVPAPFKDFAEKGWEYDGESDEKVPAHKYLIGAYIEKDDMDPSVYIMNDSDDEINVTEGDISCIGFDQFDMKNNEIKYGDNITMGKTTLEEVKSAFGEPDYENTLEDLGITTIRYEKDIYIEVEFKFDESGILNGFTLTNQPTDF